MGPTSGPGTEKAKSETGFPVSVIDHPTGAVTLVVRFSRAQETNPCLCSLPRLFRSNRCAPLSPSPSPSPNKRDHRPAETIDDDGPDEDGEPALQPAEEQLELRGDDGAVVARDVPRTPPATPRPRPLRLLWRR